LSRGIFSTSFFNPGCGLFDTFTSETHPSVQRIRKHVGRGGGSIGVSNRFYTADPIQAVAGNPPVMVAMDAVNSQAGVRMAIQ
jgi:hypothetical protein